MKRILIGLLWAVGCYFGSLFTIGFFYGVLISNDVQSEQEAYDRGSQLGEELAVPLLLLSMGVGIVGTATQTLPGTRE